MASIVSSVGGLGILRRRAARPARLITEPRIVTVEQAARLSPEWGRLEAPRAYRAEPRPLPDWPIR